MVLQVLLGAIYFGAVICRIIVNCNTQVKKLLVDSIIFHVSWIFFSLGSLGKFVPEMMVIYEYFWIFFSAHTNSCSILCLSCGRLTQLEGAVKFQTKVGEFWEFVKNSLNLISFPPIPPNFGENENLRFWGNRKEWVFPPNHSIPFHLNS